MATLGGEKSVTLDKVSGKEPRKGKKNGTERDKTRFDEEGPLRGGGTLGTRGRVEKRSEERPGSCKEAMTSDRRGRASQEAEAEGLHWKARHSEGGRMGKSVPDLSVGPFRTSLENSRKDGNRREPDIPGGSGRLKNWEREGDESRRPL